MGILLDDLLAGTTFNEFCKFMRDRVLLDDLYVAPPTVADLEQLFNLYDLDSDGVLSITEAELLNERLLRAINGLRCALIVVDFQNDFVSGSLSIRHGPARQDPTDALAPLNRLLQRQSRFRRVIYTMDWHPVNHISFFEHCRNADRTLSEADKIRKLKPFDVVHFENPNFRQVLYPTHCVQNSWGADLSAELVRAENAKYVLKGSQVFVDAYSGFVDNRGEYRSELESILKQEKIKALFICGLALDICVAATAKDAAKLGFYTAVIVDCSKGLADEQIRSTGDELRQLNVAFINSTGVESFTDSRRLPWQWIRQLSGVDKAKHATGLESGAVGRAPINSNNSHHYHQHHRNRRHHNKKLSTRTNSTGGSGGGAEVKKAASATPINDVSATPANNNIGEMAAVADGYNAAAAAFDQDSKDGEEEGAASSSATYVAAQTNGERRGSIKALVSLSADHRRREGSVSGRSMSVLDLTMAAMHQRKSEDLPPPRGGGGVSVVKSTGSKPAEINDKSACCDADDADNNSGGQA